MPRVLKTESEIRKKLKRPLRAHKGSFGRIFLLAGARGYAGAASLAARGALRSGAGLVTLGVPEKIYSLAAEKEEEVMVRPLASTSQGTLAYASFSEIKKFMVTQNVLGIGPGLTREASTQKLIRRVIETSLIPLVIDADGLNALQGRLEILKSCRGRAVLTPHPGEFKRLFGGPLSDSDTLRKKRAAEIAQRHQVTIVLKGHHTVIADPSGGIWLNPTGNPGMATGGTGDVLTGIITALLGQKLSCPDAARFGVYVHGLAGDIAAKKIGPISLTAGDLLNCLPQAFRRIVS